MNRTRRILLVVAVVAVLLAAAAALTWRSAAAPAVQEPEPGARERQAGPVAASVPEAPVPGGPGFVMLDPCAFRPRYPTTEWDYYEDWQLYNPGAFTSGYVANLVLPNKVTITQMVVYFYDNSTVGPIIVHLYRNDPASAGWVDMANVVTAGAQPQYRSSAQTDITEPVVDQQSYTYSLTVGISPGGDQLRLTGIRIDYAYATSLPLILNDQ
jgi:hypothetical protein